MLILTNGMSNHFQPAHLFEISDIEFSEMEMEMEVKLSGFSMRTVLYGGEGLVGLVQLCS